MKDFKVTVPIPAVSDRMFDADIKHAPIETTEDVPALAEANEQMARVKRQVKSEMEYGLKGEDDLG